MTFINVYATKVHKKKSIIKQLYRKIASHLKTSSDIVRYNLYVLKESPFRLQQ